MEEPKSGNSVKFHRVLKAPPERVYRAFLDPKARCRWVPPYGFLAEMHHSDERVGGTYRMSFINFGTGAAHSFGGTYLELVPSQRICYSDKFEDPSMPNEMKVTVTFRPVMCGTELSILQENLPSQIPTEFCYLGWQESLTQLANLVEPEIP